MLSQLQTRYASVGRTKALLLLLLLIVFATYLALVAHADGFVKPPSNRPGDLELYRAIVSRVHAGENYYSAAGDELRHRGYGLKSVFNWRPPLLAMFIGAAPRPEVAQYTLAGICLLTLIVVRIALRPSAGAMIAIAIPVSLFYSAFMGAFTPAGYYFTELWAGVLICLSACAYGLKSWRAGFLAAILALFIRELVAPYIVLCVILAWRDKRREELFAWAGGLALFALYFAVHVVNVKASGLPSDRAYPDGWVQFGGFRFLLLTANWSGLVIAMNPWCTGAYLAIALFGLLGWRGELATRVTWATLAYLLLFSIVGKRVNDYWGMIYTPMLTFGVVWAVVGLFDLFKQLIAASSAIHRPLPA